MSSVLFEVLNEATRLLFLGLLPLVAVVCFGSILATICQASLSIHDLSFSFGIRFLSFLLALYLFLPSIITSLVELARMSYGT